MVKADYHTPGHQTFVYRTDAENRITFLNQEWLDFAKENQAPELNNINVLGQPLEKFITGWETKHLYGIIYERVRQTGKEMHFPFRCDSPDRRRYFQMRISLLEEGGLEFTAKVIRIEPRPWNHLFDNSVERSSELVVICSWCKRIRVDRTHWAKIEDVLEKQEFFGAAPPTLTHGVCRDCLANIHDLMRKH